MLFRPVDPSHKSHNASDKYSTLHHFVAEMCTHLCISVTKVVHCGVWDWCIVGFVQQVYCPQCITEDSKLIVPVYQHSQSSITFICYQIRYTALSAPIMLECIIYTVGFINHKWLLSNYHRINVKFGSHHLYFVMKPYLIFMMWKTFPWSDVISFWLYWTGH